MFNRRSNKYKVIQANGKSCGNNTKYEIMQYEESEFYKEIEGFNIEECYMQGNFR